MTSPLSKSDIATMSMSDEQEGRAYRGYCPKCNKLALKLVHCAAVPDMAVKVCAACGVMVVLEDGVNPQ